MREKNRSQKRNDNKCYSVINILMRLKKENFCFTNGICVLLVIINNNRLPTRNSKHCTYTQIDYNHHKTHTHTHIAELRPNYASHIVSLPFPAPHFFITRPRAFYAAAHIHSIIAAAACAASTPIIKAFK